MRLSVLLISGLSIFAGGCDLCIYRDCGCGNSRYKGLQVINDLTLEDYSDYGVLINSVNYNDYYKVGKELTIASYSPLLSMQPRTPRWQLIPAAMACDPVIPQATTYFTRISIIAESAVNYLPGKSWLAGDTINEYFSIRSTNTWQTQDLDDFLASHDRIFVQDAFLLKVQSQPMNQLELKFRVEFGMVDGKTYQFPDQTLRIK